MLSLTSVCIIVDHVAMIAYHNTTSMTLGEIGRVRTLNKLDIRLYNVLPCCKDMQDSYAWPHRGCN
jgi:hypothetical protein